MPTGSLAHSAQVASATLQSFMYTPFGRDLSKAARTSLASQHPIEWKMGNSRCCALLEGFP